MGGKGQSDPYLFGEKYEAVSEAAAGTVCAVTGLTKTYPGEGLGIEEESILPVLEPVRSVKLDFAEGSSGGG